MPLRRVPLLCWIPAPGRGGRDLQLRAAPSPLQKPDAVGSRRLLLGRINKAAAAQRAGSESSAPPFLLGKTGLCPTLRSSCSCNKGEAATKKELLPAPSSALCLSPVPHRAVLPGAAVRCARPASQGAVRAAAQKTPFGICAERRGSSAEEKGEKCRPGAAKGKGSRERDGNEVILSSATTNGAVLSLPVLPVLAYTSSWEWS